MMQLSYQFGLLVNSLVSHCNQSGADISLMYLPKTVWKRKKLLRKFNINDINILWESSDDTSNWCPFEKIHRTSENALKHIKVKLSSCFQEPEPRRNINENRGKSCLTDDIKKKRCWRSSPMFVSNFRKDTRGKLWAKQHSVLKMCPNMRKTLRNPLKVHSTLTINFPLRSGLES